MGKEEIKKWAFLSFCHDIGKFIQRAEQEESRRGKPEKRHEEYSIDFVSDYLPTNIAELMKDIKVMCADWLSAWERKTESNTEVSQNKVYQTPLVSLFSKIGLGVPENKERKKHEYYYNIAKLSFSNKYKHDDFEQKFFPKTKNEIVSIDYSNLYKEFKEEIIKSGIDPFEDFNTFLFICQKYLSFVPSAVYPVGITVPDVPLFDHMKLVSAITSCLAVDEEEGEIKKEDMIEVMMRLVMKLEEYAEKEGEESISRNFRDLARGMRRALEEIARQEKIKIEKAESDEFAIFSYVYLDLCGIQDFIYKIAQPGDPRKGVAKQLRGRSFYLNVFLDVITRWLCDELGLTYSNIIFCGGGNAYMFIPMAFKETARRKLDDLNKKILEKFLGEIFVAFHIGDVLLSDWFNFGNFLDRMIKRTAREKLRKFYSSDFLVEKTGYDLKECQACRTLRVESEKNDEKELCDFCESFVKLGQVLTKEPVMIIFPKIGDKIRELPQKGVYLDFFVKDILVVDSQTEDIEDLLNSITKGVQEKLKIEFLSFSTENFWFPFYSDKQENLHKLKNHMIKIEASFKPLVVHVPYYDDGESGVKSFEDIARCRGIVNFGDKLPDGDEKLGILKADVDNLGKILKYAFRGEGLANKPYPSRFVAFSRMLEIFFGVYVPLFARDFNKNIYMVYSGGDDLFAISRWDIILDFAVRLREKFKRYTAENEIFSISAGFTITSPSTPVRIFSTQVDDNLKKAKREQKSSVNTGNGIKITPKDKIFFLAPLKWSELEKTIKLGKKMSLWVKDKKISRSFIHRIIEIYNQFFAGENKREEDNIMWYPLLYYSAVRNIYDKEIRREFISYLTEQEIKYLFISSYYSLLKTREK